jgi:hypothetical protein
MSREAIEVGSFTWSRIQRLHDSDAIVRSSDCNSALGPLRCAVRTVRKPRAYIELGDPC